MVTKYLIRSEISNICTALIHYVAECNLLVSGAAFASV